MNLAGHGATASQWQENSEGGASVLARTRDGYRTAVNFNQMPLSSDDYNQSVVENVFLLVGRRENVEAPEVGTDQTLDPLYNTLAQDDRDKLRQKLNWLLGNARWIVIGSQSGRIVTEENTAVDPGAIYATYGNAHSEKLRNEQIKAAREFTREMSQLGGK